MVDPARRLSDVDQYRRRLKLFIGASDPERRVSTERELARASSSVHRYVWRIGKGESTALPVGRESIPQRHPRQVRSAGG